jgi:hypothetical protein
MDFFPNLLRHPTAALRLAVESLATDMKEV